MSATLDKALAALVPVCALITWLTVLLRKRRTVFLELQLVGAVCLLIVVLAHVCEASHLFPRMRWGEPDSPGHYLDLSSAIAGITLLSSGYVLERWRQSR